MTHPATMRRLPITLLAALLGMATSAAAADLSAPTNRVMPLRLPAQHNPEVRAVQDQLYGLVERQARYLITTARPWAAEPATKRMTESKSLEHWIRPNAMALVGFAFLYRFGPYDEKTVGLSRQELLEQVIIPVARYLAVTHVAGSRPTDDGKPWGDHWQSAYWAQLLGRAVWWTWDDLPDDLRQGVRRVVAHEADRFVDREPPHQLKNDTKAEENSWNSMIFNVAVLLMPDDPRRAAWEKNFQRWAMSSYLRPADEHSSAIVDGRKVSEQFTGANIYDDFTLENHRMVHPDYMSAFVLALSCTLDYAMTGRRPPEALQHNVRGVYDNLKWFFLPDGGCVYPNGEDWELLAPIAEPEVHVEMAVFLRDPDAWSMLKKCLATAAKMRARSPEGPIYQPEEFFYPGAHHSVLDTLARAWLILQTAEEIIDRPSPKLGVKQFEFGKIIIHRTPTAVHTVSWGPVIMAQCVPWRLDRVVSPDKRDGVGAVRLTGEKDILPVRLEAANVAPSPNGFVAELTVDHGDALRAELRFESLADGSFRMREKLTALRDCATAEIATGLIGVLNNPKWVYERHQRRIQFDNETVDVPALSGKTFQSPAVRRIDIDKALVVESPAPLRAAYEGAAEVDCGRATDMLYLNHLNGEKSWRAGEVVSQYDVRLHVISDAHAPARGAIK